jgi:hypothetical protein
MMKWFLKGVFLLLLLAGKFAEGFSSKHEIQLLNYNVTHTIPAMGTHHRATVTRDELTCFGNWDLIEPSYLDTLLCMLNLPEVLHSYSQCTTIWGSRGVVVNVIGSVEFLQVKRFPAEASEVPLQATRWLEVQSLFDDAEQREIKHVSAQPFYLCARSIDWKGRDSSFQIEFRPVYLRARDSTRCGQKLLLHLLLVVAVSSLWLLPYIASFVFSVYTYTHGMHRFMMSLAFAVAVVCLAPLMFTKRNRYLARMYIDYFFNRRNIRETSEFMQEGLPLFQALFFSCALMCTGCAGAYIIYSYLGVNREVRNAIIQVAMGLSMGWFVFVLCRSFERFFQRWSWLALTACLLQFLEPHLNPQCWDEAVVIVLFITAIVEYALVPQFNLHENLGKVRDLLGMGGASVSGSHRNVALFSPPRLKRRSGSGSRDLEMIDTANAALDPLTSSDENYDSTDAKGAGSAKKEIINITVNVQVERGANEQLLVRSVRDAVKKAVHEAIQ